MMQGNYTTISITARKIAGVKRDTDHFGCLGIFGINWQHGKVQATFMETRRALHLAGSCLFV